MRHPAFSLGNPNRVRSLIASFSLNNPTQFHRPDGAGYDLTVEVVLALDGKNPQVAARLLTAFNTWRMVEAGAACARRPPCGGWRRHRASPPTSATSPGGRSPRYNSAQPLVTEGRNSPFWRADHVSING